MNCYDDKDVDTFEHEVEYDRLCSALNGSGINDLISRLHANQSCQFGGSKLMHLHTVSELAAHHANKFFEESDFNEQDYKTKACRMAGLLHETMLAGTTFEDIVDVTDERVAKLVSMLTPDVRVPKPRRYKTYVNQIGLADESTQLVKLADIQHECRQFLGIPKSKLSVDIATAIEDWRLEMIDMLASMHRIREASGIASQFAELRADMLYLSTRCKAKMGLTS